MSVHVTFLYNSRFEVCKTSQLFTWQDGRCTPEFLSSLPTPQSHLKLASGLGCCTILWLLKNKKELLEKLVLYIC